MTEWGWEASINLYHRDIVTSKVCEGIFSARNHSFVAHEEIKCEIFYLENTIENQEVLMIFS